MSDKNHRDQLLDRALNRRNILLGSTTLAAGSLLGSGAPTRIAQAQQQPAPAPAPASGGKPNIVVIWGDDIGQATSAFSPRD